MITPKHVSAVVTSRRDISSDLWIVRIRPEEKISFAPGQYATVGLPGAGRLVERPYSIASSTRDGQLEFFLELVPGGHLSPHLYDVAPGGQVYVRREAKGRFLFDDKSGHTDHFMIATVTGAAPFVSMLREFAARHEEGTPVPYRIAMLHAASISRELGYCEELSGYARRYSWFTYIPTISRGWIDSAWGGELGRAEDVLRKHMDTLGFGYTGTTVYACGNPNMIENVKAVLERARFPKEFVKQEVYWVAEKG
ncbi:MAG: FAD-binding oxidoreductase [Acidobacteriota bacterium]